MAKQTVGGFFRAIIQYGHTWTGYDFGYEAEYRTGPILFLPCPTKKTAELMIDLLIDSLTGGVQKEPIAPEWEKSVEMPRLSDCFNELHGLEKQIQLLNKRADETNKEITSISKLRRLLWADGKPFETVVKEAFTILGFPEIRKIRDENLEDWVIDFKYWKDHKYAVFEVKASEKRTSMADLTQCNKWVEDYLLEDKKVKGVFVSNQYRLQDIVKGTKEREYFPRNELDYARTREICILPSTQIFEAVKSRMKSNSEPTRETIEKKIAEANGLCSLA
jgi:hypothetical protein